MGSQSCVTKSRENNAMQAILLGTGITSVAVRLLKSEDGFCATWKLVQINVYH